MKTFLVKFVLFSCVLVVALEVIFRVALPAADRPQVAQIQNYGILALDREHTTSGRNTMGRYCRPAFRWHVNNAGFNSAIDYRSAAARSLPCAVVVGNSYAQGLYSDVEENLAGCLNTGLSGRMEVYNLGMAGMPLSQVPLVVRYAVEQYNPELIIIQTSARSVPGSLEANGWEPFSQQFSVRDGLVVAHPPEQFHANKYKHVILHSALVRYLLYNANYNLGGKGLAQDVNQAPPAAPGAADAVTPDSPVGLVLAEIMRAVSEAAPDARVLIVHDADRAAMYETGRRPARLVYSAALEYSCRERGFEFLDMTDYFWQKYEADGKKVNFDGNYHWNPYGVSLVAHAVLGTIKDRGLIGD